ncbi:hypothetical protein [Symmachiella dynata]|uniref:hypothetical protein n=1 Tax=Symmachiella dynata TaxID=2527995 RepID=UPI0030ED5237
MQVRPIDLLFALLAFVGAMCGVSIGLGLGSDFGILGKTVGGVLGLIVGVTASVLFGLFAAVVRDLLDRIWRRWRPYPPPCENGTCVHASHFRSTEIPDEIVHAVAGLAKYGQRCRCGNLYSSGIAHGLLNRWVRVLPDGTIRAYLIHRPFGRWEPDNSTEIKPGMIERVLDRFGRILEGQVPGWVVPPLMTIIFAGIASYAVYAQSGFQHPFAFWFIGALATCGFVGGCVFLWKGPAHFEGGD